MGLTSLRNIWGHITMVPACSSGALTNVLPHRNAMPQTQDTTPHPRHSIQTWGRPCTQSSQPCTQSSQPQSKWCFVLFWVLCCIETSEVISKHRQCLLVAVVLWPMCCLTQIPWHDTPPHHSIHTRGWPITVLSIDVERHTGIYSYPNLMSRVRPAHKILPWSSTHNQWMLNIMMLLQRKPIKIKLRVLD